MRGREFLEKLEQVSPAYVEAADRIPIVKVKRWPKLAAAAACLCLIAVGAWGLSGGPGMSGLAGTPGMEGLPAQVRTTRPPDAFLDTAYSNEGFEPCRVLGLEECWVRSKGPEDAANWWYYVPNGDGTYRLVAESWWNAKCAAPYEADLDGDGVEELIFNLVYDGGLREVQVVRSRNGELEEGYFSNEFLRGLWDEQGLAGAPGGYESCYRSWYDPERGFVVEHNGLDADGKEVQTVDVFQDLEHFKFRVCSIGINSEKHYEPPVSEEPTQPPTSAPEDGEAMAAIQEVLAGNTKLIHVEQSGGTFPLYVHEIKGVYIADLPENVQVPMDFTVLDLDGDGVREAVIGLDRDGSGLMGFEILHYEDGVVYGFLCRIRGFAGLRADGTFLSSDGAASYGFGRLAFAESGYYTVENSTYCDYEGPGWGENMYYVVDHQPATEAEFAAAQTEFLDKQPAEWYALTEENITAMFDEIAGLVTIPLGVATIQVPDGAE